MLMQILVHTPVWVFGLFVVLLGFGATQWFDRRASLVRVSALPLAMVGLSLSGVLMAFGAHPSMLLAWAIAAGLAAAAVYRRPVPAGTAYDPLTRQFQLKGSALPLALMMAIFFTKYAVGATLAMSPEMARVATFALPVCAVYGVFSGVFLGRAMRLWRLAGGTSGGPSPQTARS